MNLNYTGDEEQNVASGYNVSLYLLETARRYTRSQKNSTLANSDRNINSPWNTFPRFDFVYTDQRNACLARQ